MAPKLKRLWSRLLDRNRAPRCWWYPVPRAEVRQKDMVRDAHQKFSETINKTMFTLLGIALFCLLTVFGSPDKLLLAENSTIKVPLADAPLSFLGFIIVAPFLLLVLTIYLHIFFGYWLEYERERQYLNQRLVGSPEPLIQSLPTLFSFPDTSSRLLTSFIFYWLVPLVFVTITIKAWARRDMGLPLTYVTGLATGALVFLQGRRQAAHKRKRGTPIGCTILLLITGLMVYVTIQPDAFRRPLDLFRADLSQAWLVGRDMRDADARIATLSGANLSGANLSNARLSGANLSNADLSNATLSGATLSNADLSRARLDSATLSDANLQNIRRLTQEQVNQACGNEHTKLPADLKPPPPCPQ